MTDDGVLRLSYTLPLPDGTVRTYHALCAYPFSWFLNNGVELTLENVEAQVSFGLKKKVQAIFEAWTADGGTI